MNCLDCWQNVCIRCNVRKNWKKQCILATLFFDIIFFLVGARPLNWWIKTFQTCFWPYFWVWDCTCKLIQLFPFASFILYFETDGRHRNFLDWSAVVQNPDQNKNTNAKCPKWVFEIWHEEFFTFLEIFQIILIIE